MTESLLFIIKLVISLLILVPIIQYFLFVLSEKNYYFSDTRIFYLSSDLKNLKFILEKLIDKYIDNTSEYNLIEPGAGLANISSLLSKRFKWNKIEAIEINPQLVLYGQIINWFRGSKISYVNQDIFDYSFPEQSLIYCYLGHKIMKKLYDEGKFAENIVISLTFDIEGLKPTEVVEVKGFQKELFVYDLRKN